ncbi:hypothetical protein JAAARDRAFT_38901 [Jaapia argillacea MUCL 33604]|uniref:Uncharacterized protein n=1 Tax=Jaapia argillacea MUCL 33604 TaxID=933084 RepID=A0A067PJE0_9AGAM|nr:hypothetical protein JAAARDRAFT_38901 [Jaapia argillacea MUCL 33604]
MISMTFAVLLLFAFWTVAASAKTHSLRSLTKDCRFTLDAHEYDLCPIFTPQHDDKPIVVAFGQKTPPTITRTEYRIALGGALKTNESLPEHEQCPDGTWICLMTYNRRPEHRSEPPRILQVIPVAGSLKLDKDLGYWSGLNATAELGKTEDRHPALNLRLHGGYYVDKPHKALFNFICDHKVEEPSSPKYSWSWNGTHTFTWATQHACGKALAEDPPATSTAPPPPPEPAPEPEPEPAKPEPESPPQETQPEDDQFANPPPSSPNSRRFSSFTILFLSSAAVLSLFYLVYRPPILLRRAVLKLMKRYRIHNFRVGEHTLVEWAQADMYLDPDGEDLRGEEDFMVNAREDDYDALDEQIPLTPSPRKGRFISNYGSATAR